MARTKFRTRKPFKGRAKNKNMVRNTAKKTVELEDLPVGLPTPPQVENNSESLLPGRSATAKKFSFFDVSFEDQATADVSDKESTSDCYVIAQKSSLQNLFGKLLCPSCKKPGIVFELLGSKTCGFSGKGELTCQECSQFSNEEYLCARVGNSKSTRAPFEINVRATLAFRGIGCGYAAIKEWCGLMDMPYSISQDSYTKNQAKIQKASMETFDELSKQSVGAITAAYADMGVHPDASGILDIDVSYDGAWQRRGHSSHNGMGAVIDLITGLPLDFEILSNFCLKCKIAAEKPEDPEWKAKHAANCAKYLDGLPMPWKLNVPRGCGGDPLRN